jgi:hypothetical protein
MKKLQMSLIAATNAMHDSELCLIAFELPTQDEQNVPVNIKSRWWLSAALGPITQLEPASACCGCLSTARANWQLQHLLRRSLITTGLVGRYHS